MSLVAGSKECPIPGTSAYQYWGGPFPPDLNTLHHSLPQRTSYAHALELLKKCFDEGSGEILLDSGTLLPLDHYCGRVPPPACWNRGHQYAHSGNPTVSYLNSVQNLLPEDFKANIHKANAFPSFRECSCATLPCQSDAGASLQAKVIEYMRWLDNGCVLPPGILKSSQPTGYDPMHGIKFNI